MLNAFFKSKFIYTLNIDLPFLGVALTKPPGPGTLNVA